MDKKPPSTSGSSITRKKPSASLPPPPPAILPASSPSRLILVILVPFLFFIIPFIPSTVPNFFSLSSSSASYSICSHANSHQIWSMNPTNDKIECISVDGKSGLVTAVGNLKEARKAGKVIRLKEGEMMIPGLIDSHAHLLQNGESSTAVDLAGCEDAQEAVLRIAEYIENDPTLRTNTSKFILGVNWDQTKWVKTGKNFPTANDLDQHPTLVGRPIYLKRVDVHALWVSNTIISLIPSIPSTISGGLIIRDPITNAPTGVFVDNAMSLILPLIPSWTPADRLRFWRSTEKEMLRTGLTGVGDASLMLEDIEFFKKMDRDGKLKVRVAGMVYCEPINTFCGDEVERYDGDRFGLRTVKLFLDGALGSWGAALHEPYSDKPAETGILISPEEDFGPVIKKWMRKGFQVASHAIGDKANTVVIDAYEDALKELGDDKDWRLRIEHAQVIRLEDITRMGKMNIIASYQPTHATSDMGYAETRLGPERILGAYAWKTALESGSRLALGSDFPVEAVDPISGGLYSAIFRLDKQGNSPHGPNGWFPEQRLTLKEALRGFTIDAAFAAFQEHRVGSLEVGKEADFVVLNKNLEGLDWSEWKDVRVKATVVAGKVAWGKL